MLMSAVVTLVKMGFASTTSILILANVHPVTQELIVIKVGTLI